jgi:hypothetical protein
LPFDSSLVENIVRNLLTGYMVVQNLYSVCQQTPKMMNFLINVLIGRLLALYTNHLQQANKPVSRTLGPSCSAYREAQASASLIDWADASRARTRRLWMCSSRLVLIIPMLVTRYFVCHSDPLAVMRLACVCMLTFLLRNPACRVASFTCGNFTDDVHGQTCSPSAILAPPTAGTRQTLEPPIIKAQPSCRRGLCRT